MNRLFKKRLRELKKVKPASEILHEICGLCRILCNPHPHTTKELLENTLFSFYHTSGCELKLGELIRVLKHAPDDTKGRWKWFRSWVLDIGNKYGMC